MAPTLACPFLPTHLPSQVQNEQLTSILRKVEGESEFVGRQVAGMLEKGERLQEVYSKLAKSLEHTEGQVVRAALDVKALATEQEAVDRASTKVGRWGGWRRRGGGTTQALKFGQEGRGSWGEGGLEERGRGRAGGTGQEERGRERAPTSCASLADVRVKKLLLRCTTRHTCLSHLRLPLHACTSHTCVFTSDSR